MKVILPKELKQGDVFAEELRSKKRESFFVVSIDSSITVLKRGGLYSEKMRLPKNKGIFLLRNTSLSNFKLQL